MSCTCGDGLYISIFRWSDAHVIKGLLAKPAETQHTEQTLSKKYKKYFNSNNQFQCRIVIACLFLSRIAEGGDGPPSPEGVGAAWGHLGGSSVQSNMFGLNFCNRILAAMTEEKSETIGVRKKVSKNQVLTEWTQNVSAHF